MSDHQSLIERVEGLSGPCRETDYALFKQLEPEKAALTVYNGSLEGTVPAYMAPPYTASIDAALSLVERKLPGRSAEILFAAVGDPSKWSRPERKSLTLPEWLPRSIILALLRALQSQEEGR